jgi:peroxiredoxin
MFVHKSIVQERNVMRVITVLTVALGCSSAMWARPPVPRPAENFLYFNASGNQLSLSSLRGKVVLLQFLDTDCPHCQAMSRMLSKLQTELGPRGFQALGVAFNEATADMVRNYTAKNSLSIPVGYASRDDVVRYLGISVMERLTVPQVLIIDRKGQVVAQSDPMGTPALQDESYLRGVVINLLGQRATAGTAPHF